MEGLLDHRCYLWNPRIHDKSCHIAWPGLNTHTADYEGSKSVVGRTGVLYLKLSNLDLDKSPKDLRFRYLTW